MAPFTPHYEAATTYSPAAQDGFDAKLNQTIFAAAFGIAGLVFLGVTAYLSYWVVGRCSRTRRRASTASSCMNPKTGPRALLLPAQVATHGEDPRLHPRLASALTGTEHDSQSDEKMGECERDRIRFWFSKMRTAKTKGISGSDHVRTQSLARPPQAHLNTRDSCSAEAVTGQHYSPPFTSSKTVGLNQVSPSSGTDPEKVPRIMVEDLEPMSEPERSLRDSVSSSSSGSNSDMSVEEKERGDGLLAVPPMSWNAPRNPMEDDKGKGADTDTTQQQTLDDTYPTLKQVKHRNLATTKSKPKCKSKIFSVLADLSNIARFRPKVPPHAISR